MAGPFLKPPKGIGRIDDDDNRVHGWRVRVQWRGKFRSRRFADLAHGSAEKSLDAAVLWRDKIEDEMGKPRTERHIRSSGVHRGGKRWTI